MTSVVQSVPTSSGGTALLHLDLEPSENWDDDFEFNPSSATHSPTAATRSRRPAARPREQLLPPLLSSSRNGGGGSHEHEHHDDSITGGLTGLSPGIRMSIASSEYTMEDWDAESQFGGPEPSSSLAPGGGAAVGASLVRVDDAVTPTKPHRRSLSSSPRELRRLSGGGGMEHHQTIPVPISMALAAWSEEGPGDPKTPVKNRFPLSDHTNTNPKPSASKGDHDEDDGVEGENWDDDFEDRTFSSPVRKGKAVARRTLGDDDDGDDAGAHESWDEEFAAEEDKDKEGEVTRLGMGPPPPASRRTPVKSRRKWSSASKRASTAAAAADAFSSSSDEEEEGEGKKRGKIRYSLSEDGDFYDSEEGAGEFGEEDDDDEEDRTVTARSKRSIHHHNHHHHSHHHHHRPTKESPPPPVPRLPFLASSPPSTPALPSAGAGGAASSSGGSPRPFPRSPTSSVFSVPATLAETRSSYTYTSTTHLRPSISRGSSAAGAAATSLSHLPPSPPIHKDRERRRLRKKSRPSGQGAAAFEMATFGEGGDERREKRKSGGYLYSFSDGELEEIREKERERGVEEGGAERILPRRGMSPDLDVLRDQGGAEVQGGSVVPVAQQPPPTPRGPGALLSRIGSVTSKWNAGRKSRRSGASTTPSEVARDEAQHTPRPQSSMSSLHLHLSNSNNSKNGHSAPPLPASNTSNATAANTNTSSSSNWFFRSSSSQSQSGAGAASPPTATKPKSKYAPRSVGRGASVGAARRSRPGTGGSGAVNNNAHDDGEYAEPDDGATAEIDDPTTTNSNNNHNAASEHYDYGEFDKTPVATPAKLVKRKSMGFVALRRGLGSGGGGGEKARYQREKERERDGGGESSASASVREEQGRERKVGLGGNGAGRPMSMVQSGGSRPGGGRGVPKGRGVSDTYRRREREEDVDEDVGDPFSVGGRGENYNLSVNNDAHTKSSANADSSAPEAVPNHKAKEKEKETTSSRDLGLRSIMGNVRKLSIVGVASRDRARHKRTQSSTSAAAASPTAVAAAIAGGRMSSGWTRPLTPSTSVPQLRASVDLKLKAPAASVYQSPGPDTHTNGGTTANTDGSADDAKMNGDASDSLKTPSKSSSSSGMMKRTGSLRDRSGALGVLLPPIELQPPSPSPPPKDNGKGSMNMMAMDLGGQDNKAGGKQNSSPRAGGTLAPVTRSPHSPGQSASLGRASPFVVATTTTGGLSNSATTSGSSTTANSNANSNTSTVKDLGGTSTTTTTTVLRRNSLGDLKIPARISQAQVSLRRDLGMVREFAGHVESLKLLQNTYDQLSGEIHALLDQHAATHARAQVQQALMAPPPLPPSRPESRTQTQNPSNGSLAQPSNPPRATSPMGFFNLANLSRTNLGLNLKGRRRRSSTNPEGSSASASTLSLTGSGAAVAGVLTTTTTMPISTPAQEAYKELATALYTINSKYRISWECAELLIELGGGTSSGGGGGGIDARPTFVNAPVPQRSSSRTSTRERAVTLAGDDRAGTPVQGSRPGSRVGSYSSTSSHHPQGINTTAHYHNHNHAPPMSSPLNSVGPSHSTPAVPSSSTSPPLASPESWRASTGRHDLSQRQLSLLKEMLNQPEGGSRANPHNYSSRTSHLMQPGSRLSIPEEPPAFATSGAPVNREWRWGGDAMGSTVTLPPSDHDQDGEESGVGTDRTGGTGETGTGGVKPQKKRRLTMSGFRDMLRALRRNAAAQVQDTQQVPGQGQQALLARTRVAAAASTTSLSAGSSFDGHSVHSPLSGRSQQQTQRRVIQKRRPKSGVGLDEQQKGPSSSSSVPLPPAPPAPPPSSFNMPLPPKSPRRPSLASIFRIGNHSNSTNSKNAKSLGPVPQSADSSKSRGNRSVADGSTSSCYPDDEDGDLAYDGDDGDRGEEEDWDQIDSASDLDLDAGFGVSGTDAGATIRGASSSKGRKPMGVVDSGGADQDRSGKKSPYLQQDPYAYRSSSGLGRRIVSAGATPSASSSSVNVSQTSLVNKPEESNRNRSGTNNANNPTSPSTASVGASGSVRQLKLSDVQENAGESEWPVRTSSLSRKPGSTPQKRTASPHSIVTNRSVSGGGSKLGGNKTGSVRSMPPQPFSPSSISSGSNLIGSPSVYSQSGGGGSGGGSGGVSSHYPDIKLTFTPENIRPLLENAREVQLRLKECIEEMRVLAPPASVQSQ